MALPLPPPASFVGSVFLFFRCLSPFLHFWSRIQGVRCQPKRRGSVFQPRKKGVLTILVHSRKLLLRRCLLATQPRHRTTSSFEKSVVLLPFLDRAWPPCSTQAIFLPLYDYDKHFTTERHCRNLQEGNYVPPPVSGAIFFPCILL